MRIAKIEAADDFEGWRDLARGLAAQDVPADQIVWQIGEAPADLFGAHIPAIGNKAAAAPGFLVPRSFLALARLAVCHRDPERFSLLYALLRRLRDTPALIEDRTDPLLHRLEAMAKDMSYMRR